MMMSVASPTPWVMDIRNPVCAILVGGTPAPGINGVISAIVLECLNNNITCIGVRDGFKHVREGRSDSHAIHRFERSDVTGLYCQGGSMLRTSRVILENDGQVENCLCVLEHLRVRYLVTIGGTVTAYCAGLVAMAARNAERPLVLSVVHVPKSIFNDLPLPHNAHTFGFATARETGTQILRNLKQDARTMERWYVVVIMGQKAGHLTLGIGKAGSATVTLIPEDYKRKKCTFSHICDILEGSIIKRMAMSRYYGCACLSEGLVDRMDPVEVRERWGDIHNAHQELGRDVVKELKRRFLARETVVTMFARNLGTELRAADPNATDTDLAQNLGFGATKFLLDDGNGCMVAVKGGRIAAVELDKIIDKKTGRTQIRLVDTESLMYKVAKRYMVLLNKEDMDDPDMLKRLVNCSKMKESDFIAKFLPIARVSGIPPPIANSHCFTSPASSRPADSLAVNNLLERMDEQPLSI